MDATERLLAAARAVAKDAAIFPELVRSTGLSPEGVRLALDEHMETSTSDEAIERFVLKFADTSLVTVVLSSNVFVGALRAIACARAKGERVVVRPSSREPAFATALVRRAADPGIELVERVDIRAITQGEIHVYGRDETIEKVKRAARVPVVGHGHGLGVGWLTVGADAGESIERIARDVVVFDQRGCLSLRVLFVEGGPTRALEVAKLLHKALNTSRIPRGALSKDERAESLRFVDTMTMAGELFEGASHVVALTSADAPIVVPPPGRHLVVRPALNDADVLRPLEKISRYVCAFGSDDAARALMLAPRHARLSALGRMQKPPLDGHVDLRVKL
jgi:hypothetical protein